MILALVVLVSVECILYGPVVGELARDDKTDSHEFVVWLAKNGSFQCGGALIKKSWVLTAASCVYDGAPDDFDVYLGDFNTNVSGDGEQVRKSTKIIVHPDFDEASGDNDLAVVKLLAKSNTRRPNIGAVTRLSTTNVERKILKKSKTCILNSFGKGDAGPNDQLKEIKVTLSEDDQCENVPDFNGTQHICYKIGNTGSCKGDIGFPIACYVNYMWQLTGMHAYGRVEDGCRSGPKAATSITRYRKWIKKIVKTKGECDGTPTVSNGKFVVKGGKSKVGKQAFLKCHKGYIIDGKLPFITCGEDCEWSSPSATCTFQDSNPGSSCSAPPSICNGQFSSDNTSIGEKATLECDTGYLLNGDPNITCQANAQWGEKNCSCDPLSCGVVPSVANGNITLVGGDTLGEVAVLTCNEGYAASDNVLAITCQQDGNWSNADVICNSTECGSLPWVANGWFTLMGSSTVGGVAVLTCNTDFQLSEGLPAVTCEAEGEWSSIWATCDAIDCGNPPFIENGGFTSNGSRPGDVATVACDPGYDPAIDPSPKYVVCQDDGKWSDPINITCKIIRSSFGKSFLFAQMKNFDNDAGIEISVYITSSSITNVTITAPSLSYVETVTVDGVYTFTLSNSLLPSDTEISNKGVKIESDEDITVFTTNSREFTAGGNIIYPEQFLSTNYLLPFISNTGNSNGKDEVVIVGTQDNTVVTITRKDESSESKTIGYLGTYFVIADNLDGATVTASANVAVLVGNTCGEVPTGVDFCDYIAEQVPPSDSLKTSFIVSYMNPRVKFTVHVLASVDLTTVVFGDKTGAILDTQLLNASESFSKEFTNSDTISITSDFGIIVSQYGHSGKSDDVGYGDPSMTIIPAIEQYSNVYQFVVPSDYQYSKLTLFISDAYNVSGLVLNDSPVPTSNTVPIVVNGVGNFTVFNVDVPDGFNRIVHVDDGATFGAVQYGQRPDEEYAWTVGMYL